MKRLFDPKRIKTHRLSTTVLEAGVILIRKRAPNCRVCTASHFGTQAVWKYNILPWWVVDALSTKRSYGLLEEMLKMIKAFEIPPLKPYILIIWRLQA